MTPEPPDRQTDVACSLSPADMEQRMDKFAWLARLARSTEEHDDGFDLAFPSDDRLAARLFDFVVSERRCCSFFRFELVFEPDQGPIRLRLRGPGAAGQLALEWLRELRPRASQVEKSTSSPGSGFSIPIASN